MTDRPLPPPTPGSGLPPPGRDGPPGEAESWEQALRSEPMLDLPPTLVARVLLGLAPAERRRPAWAALARLAAAAASFVVAWLSLAGAAPAMAEVLPPEALAAVLDPAQEASLIPTAKEILRIAPAPPTAVAPVLGAGVLGLGLLVLGPVLARRWRRPSPRPASDE